ncbi:sulfate transporter [Candidatus Omnitrophus magneticus]|uniref:Sulfate transporter n=1 Tax=Candidatus Omnitrophus magneticus TaxID=1609969 RepID=A0A0F0CQD8_9BACT|nr:sulfate transporter [Candidatus Omnitrophus magneticus]
MKNTIFQPILFSIFKKKYSFHQFLQDLSSGIIVGIIAFPLSIAFGIASGVGPREGLITAIVAGFIISALGGSHTQIGGPTGAFVVIISGIIANYGYDGLLVAGFMAGIFLILMGLIKLGDVIKFIPYPVTLGFTSGIAVVIFTTQIRDFFGLQLTALPSEFIEKWLIYIKYITSLNPFALLISILTIVILVYFPKLSKKFPATFIALFFTTILVYAFKLPVETIGSKFGDISSNLNIPAFPNVNLYMIKRLISPAFTIALLAGIESLLSCVVADGMTGHRHRSNTELIAQGTANIFSSIFGGLPATGAIARTAANIKNGGKTPIAGIIHSLTVLLFFLFLTKIIELIPLASLAGILIIVAYNMGEWHLFAKLCAKGPASDIFVLLITFLLTIFIDLTVAIEVGLVLAAFLFMRRMISITNFKYITQNTNNTDDFIDEELTIFEKNIIPKGVEIFELYGPFFFGATDKFKTSLKESAKNPEVLILRMRHVPTIDATGLRAFEEVIEQTHREGGVIILSGVTNEVKKELNKSDVIKTIGEHNIKPNIKSALARAEVVLKWKHEKNAAHIPTVPDMKKF